MNSGENKHNSSGVLYRLSVFLVIICFFSCSSVVQRKNIFRYNEATGIGTLDPAFAKNQSVMWAIHQVYNTLVEVDDSLHIVPSVAERWEISPDNLTFTFHLRNNVFFHDDPCFVNGKGRKLIAPDIVFSFARILNKSTASSGAWIFNDRLDSMKPFTALDDSTFQLKLLRPFNPIAGILSMQYCSVIPHEAVEKYGNDFRRHPVGTGPFQFVAWEEGQALIFKKNKNYFEFDSAGNRLPYLNGVKINFYDSKATEFLEFRQNRLDFINDIDPSFKDEILTKNGSLRSEWQGKIRLLKQPFLNTEYLGFLSDTTNVLLKDSPVRSKEFRQAVNYAIDKKKLILYMRNSLGTPAESGFVPMGLPAFNGKELQGYIYNPLKALELLNQIGYNAASPQIKLITVPVYADIGSFIVNQLRQVGIKVQLEVIQKSLLLEQTSKSQALFFRGSWIADYPDAENYLSVFYSKNPAPPNYTRYKNVEFDNKYEQALAEKNELKRNELYREADRIMMKDAPVVPLWYDMVIRLYHNNVKNFKTNSLNMLELRRVKLSD
ncbi:ABC transporter substrate-binding protein [soil metagenome]